MLSVKSSPLVSYLLPLCGVQALFYLNNIMMIAFAGLAFATILPINVIFLSSFPAGLMLMSSFIFIPFAHYFLKKHGNAYSFSYSLLWGMIGYLGFAYGLYQEHKVIIFLSSIALGFHQAFAGYIRFLTSEKSCCRQMNALICSVGASVIVANFIPFYILLTKDVILPYFYVGSFLILGVINGIASIISYYVIKNIHHDIPIEKVDPVFMHWKKLYEHPEFMISSFSSMTANSVMYFLMIGLPFIMMGCGFNGLDIAYMMQFHILSMLVPMLIMPRLLKQISKSFLMLVGTGIMIMACFLLYLGSIQDQNKFLLIGILFLGIGWAMLYLSAGNMLLQCYCVCDKTGVQSANEMMSMIGASILVFCSAFIYHTYGIVGIYTISVFILFCNAVMIMKRMYFSNNRGVL